MVVLVTLLLLLLLLLVGMLLARLELYIDTYRQLYRIRWGIAFSARVDTEGEFPALVAHFGPFRKRWSVLDLLKRKPKDKQAKQEAPSKKKTGTKKDKPFPFRLIWAMLNTFRCRQFQMELDTDDYVWNAWLFTPVYLTPALRERVTVNFMGHNGLILQVDNRLWNIGIVALRYFLHRK
ncbi:MAG TPA: hypothetical protein VJ933_12425 [Phaeodactylibacter sp.]|nr:hypothetical protein [Phaeodactylibacter sp.]